MTTMSPPVRTDASVGDVLGIVHEEWMEQVTSFLAPALSEEADFWSRWSVARFLNDHGSSHDVDYGRDPGVTDARGARRARERDAGASIRLAPFGGPYHSSSIPWRSFQA